MELGYFTMPLHPPGVPVAQTLEDDLRQLTALDEMGYSEAWIGEHFTSAWENIPAPDLFIAAALSRTRNIRLGTGVTCMPNHDPFMIAHRIAQLDQMAQGRFMWGVGSGGFVGDFTVFGFDPESGEHRSMARDAVEVILDIWNDPKPGVYEHKFWRFTIPEPVEEFGLAFHMKPYQLPHPPIGVAGVSPKSETLFLAGERGWIPMSINLVPVHQLATHWDSVAEGARRGGRVPDRAQWRIAREVYVGETTEQARADMLGGVFARDFERYFKPLLSHMGQLGLVKQDADMPDDEVDAEYMLDNIWMVGSAEDVASKIRAMHERVGGFGTLLAMGHEWQPRDKWLRSMRLLKEDVLPRLADLD